MPVFCLSVHASYACAHAGACCTAGFTIPVEAPIVHGLRLRGIEAPAILDTGRGGACLFFEADGGRLCAVHRLAGPDLLPSACRHFPRVVLTDPRGTFVTLSHFCPTAAALLADSGPLKIVEAPPSLALDGRLEGLDARTVLPPLLRPGVLMDLDGYTAWERASIAVFDRADTGPETALEIIAACTRTICDWTPGHTPLAQRVTEVFDARRHAFDAEERPVKAFMAAHLFASWAPYEGGGLHAAIDAVADALARLRGEMRHAPFVDAVQVVDLQLRHTRENVSS